MRAYWSLSGALAALAEHGWFQWLLALIIVAAGTALLATVKAIVHRRLAGVAARTVNRVDDRLAEMVGRTSVTFMVAISGLAALGATALSPRVERIGRAVALVVCLVQAGVWASRALREALDRRIAAGGAEGDDPSRRTVGRMLGIGLQAGLWVIVTLVALDNLGVDITALVAGLGVGGIAVALATQNVLGDLFASISILLDKPFVPGDFIAVGDFMGTVDQIGIKTTRLRGLGGEQIVFANNDLLQSRLRNYKRMEERRAVFRLGVVYQTPVEKLASIPGMLRTIIENQVGTRFDRAHFASYGDFALSYEVVYYVLSPDYNRYMDLQQAINLEVYRAFQGQGIEFAYPTQTLVLQRTGAAREEQT